MLIVHEAHRRCGVGVDLAAEIQLRHFDDLDGPVELCTGLDAPIPFAKSLEDAVLPTKAKIVHAIKRTLDG